MLVRVKYNGKSRLLPGQIKSVVDLKSKISSLYGIECRDLPLFYKDFDNEYVVISDDEDLDNCYKEADKIKSQSITFYLRSGQEHDAHYFSTTRSNTISGMTSIRGDEYGSHPIKFSNVQIEEAINAKRGDHPHPTSKDTHDHHLTPFQEALLELKFLKRLADASKQDHPLLTLHSFLESACPELRLNPALANSVLAASSAELGQVLRQHLDQLVAEDSHAKELEAGKEYLSQWNEYLNRCKEIGENETNRELADKERKEKERIEHEAKLAKEAEEKKAHEQKLASEKEAAAKKLKPIDHKDQKIPSNKNIPTNTKKPQPQHADEHGKLAAHEPTKAAGSNHNSTRNLPPTNSKTDAASGAKKPASSSKEPEAHADHKHHEVHKEDSKTAAQKPAEARKPGIPHQEPKKTTAPHADAKHPDPKAAAHKTDPHHKEDSKTGKPATATVADAKKAAQAVPKSPEKPAQTSATKPATQETDKSTVVETKAPEVQPFNEQSQAPESKNLDLPFAETNKDGEMIGMTPGQTPKGDPANADIGVDKIEQHVLSGGEGENNGVENPTEGNPVPDSWLRPLKVNLSDSMKIPDQPKVSEAVSEQPEDKQPTETIVKSETPTKEIAKTDIASPKPAESQARVSSPKPGIQKQPTQVSTKKEDAPKSTVPASPKSVVDQLTKSPIPDSKRPPDSVKSPPRKIEAGKTPAAKPTSPAGKLAGK